MTRRFVGALIIAVMAVRSILLWIGIPVGWLYLASRVADSSQPSMGPYLMVLVGIPVTMIAMGELLAGLDRTSAASRARGRRSACRRRGTPPCAGTAGRRARLGARVVMVCSVALAVACFAVCSSCSPARAFEDGAPWQPPT
jgi:hypothetical protein